MNTFWKIGQVDLCVYACMCVSFNISVRAFSLSWMVIWWFFGRKIKVLILKCVWRTANPICIWWLFSKHFEAFRSSKTIEPNDPRDVFRNNEIFANDFLCDRVVSDCTLVITSQVRHHARMRDKCVHVFCIRFLACRKCASVKPMFQPFLHVHFTFSN